MPNGKSQEGLIRQVKSDHETDHWSVCLEAHSTGSPLGDPIEIGAVRVIFHPQSVAALHC